MMLQLLCPVAFTALWPMAWICLCNHQIFLERKRDSEAAAELAPLTFWRCAQKQHWSLLLTGTKLWMCPQETLNGVALRTTTTGRATSVTSWAEGSYIYRTIQIPLTLSPMNPAFQRPQGGTVGRCPLFALQHEKSLIPSLLKPCSFWKNGDW